jgi:hypothetical protein
MAKTRVDVLRWLAAPVLALLAVLLAQALLFNVSVALIIAIRGSAVWDGIWAAKTIASFFMGAAFVGVASGVSPSHKRRIALAAFGAVLLWTSRLAIGSFSGGHVPWLIAMGGAGALGAACAFYRTWAASSTVWTTHSSSS